MHALPLLLLTLGVAMVHLSALAQDPIRKRPRNPTGCLTRLRSDPVHFKRCKEEVCFLFREEDPFIKIPPWMLEGNHESYQRLFRCHNFSTAFAVPPHAPRLDGIAFKIHRKLSGPDHLCVWAGKDCLFNNMVDFIEIQSERTEYRFAITGLLLEISRRISPHLDPSSAIFDSKMIIIGRRPPNDVVGTIPRLTSAFEPDTWLLIAIVLLAFVALAFGFVHTFCPRPRTFRTVFLHLTRSGNEEGALFHLHNSAPDPAAHPAAAPDFSALPQYSPPQYPPPQYPSPHTLAPSQPAAGSTASSSTAAAASSSLASDSDDDSGPLAPRWSADLPPGMRKRRLSRKARARKRKRRILRFLRDRRRRREREMRERYCKSLALCESSRWLLKYGFTFFLFIVVTFYEFAVVNYLFLQQGAKLKKEVRQFERSELAEYVVLKNSAIEDVWRRNVDPEGRYSKGKPPWQHCMTVEDGLRKVKNTSDPSKFLVTFDLQARYILRKYKMCEILTVYETKNKLYACGAGWLYSGNVPRKIRRQIDKNILDMRLEDEINPIVIEEGGGPEVLKCGQAQTDIDPLIIGIPLAIIVLPFIICHTITLVLGQRKVLLGET